MYTKETQVRLTKTNIIRPIQITTTWLQFTQWIDELYNKHSQEHGLDFDESLNVLIKNGNLAFPTVLVEIMQ